MADFGRLWPLPRFWAAAWGGHRHDPTASTAGTGSVPVYAPREQAESSFWTRLSTQDRLQCHLMSSGFVGIPTGGVRWGSGGAGLRGRSMCADHPGPAVRGVAVAAPQIRPEMCSPRHKFPKRAYCSKTVQGRRHRCGWRAAQRGAPRSSGAGGGIVSIRPPYPRHGPGWRPQPTKSHLERSKKPAVLLVLAQDSCALIAHFGPDLGRSHSDTPHRRARVVGTHAPPT